jgi:hypothetical protein
MLVQLPAPPSLKKRTAHWKGGRKGPEAATWALTPGPWSVHEGYDVRCLILDPHERGSPIVKPGIW